MSFSLGATKLFLLDMEWLNGLTFNWEKIISSVVDFLRNGAGNMLGSTINAAVSIATTIGN